MVAAGELARRGQGHCRRGGVELAPTTQQRELEQQELLVREPAARDARLILVARRVQGRERVAAERKVTGHAKRRRQRLGHRVETVQVPHGEVVQQTAGKRAGRVVDRDDADGVQALAVCALQQLVLAHRDLEPARPGTHLSVHLHERPRLEHPCEVALVEPDGADGSRLVDDLRGHDPEVAAARRALAHRLDDGRGRSRRRQAAGARSRSSAAP